MKYINYTKKCIISKNFIAKLEFITLRINKFIFLTLLLDNTILNIV